MQCVVRRVVECTPYRGIVPQNWSQLSVLIMKVGLALRKFRGSTLVGTSVSWWASLVRNCVFHGEVTHLVVQIEHDD